MGPFCCQKFPFQKADLDGAYTGTVRLELPIMPIYCQYFTSEHLKPEDARG